MTLGEVVVGFAQIAAVIGAAYAQIKYRLVDSANAPTFNQVKDALRHGKALPSQWKPVDEENRAAYGLYAVCVLIFATLIFAGPWLTRFIDRF